MPASTNFRVKCQNPALTISRADRKKSLTLMSETRSVMRARHHRFARALPERNIGREVPIFLWQRSDAKRWIWLGAKTQRPEIGSRGREFAAQESRFLCWFTMFENVRLNTWAVDGSAKYPGAFPV